MKAPIKIGITGGIGTGKTVVCKIFESLRVPVYDADSRAKKLMTTDGILVGQIQKEFGNLSYTEGGVLNRSFLSRTVFNDPVKLKRLNELVHPRVALDNEEWIVENCGKSYLVKEAALLYESGSYMSLDKVVVVVSPEELRIRRIMKRDPTRSKEELLKIISSQMPESEKIKRADFQIINDENHLLIPQVLKLHEFFISLTLHSAQGVSVNTPPQH